MARIRSIKPEFWVSEQIGECSTSARLTFIGLWNFCDDNGVHPAKPKTLKAELYPMDNFAPAEIEQWVQELIAAGLVQVFEHDGASYWHVTGWSKHQKIDRPSAKHPAPPGFDSPNARRALDDGLPKNQGRVSEDSTSARRAPPPGVEGSGEEGKVSDEADASSSSAEADRQPAARPGKSGRPAGRPTIPCPYEAIVSAYHKALPLLPKVRLMDGKAWEARQKAMRGVWGWVLSSRRPDGTRRAQTAEEALAWFDDYFARAADNDFLMGRGQRAGTHANWRCDLDFLLTERGMKHVIERTAEAAA